MALSPTVRVGIIIFLALVAVAAVAWFLTGYRIQSAGYPLTATFSDALGLTPGSQVRMAGVTIGYVDEITLDKDQRAVVRMRINQKYWIPRKSRMILRVGMLIGEKYVDIIPNRQAKGFLRSGDTVTGEVPTRFEDLLPQAKRVLANLEETSESLNKLISDERMQADLRASFANIEQATARVDQTMALIQSTIAGQQNDIRAIIDDAACATGNLRSLTEDLKCFAKEGGAQEDIKATLAAARKTAESLERTTASLEKLATSPEFQDDVRQAIKESREAATEVHKVISHVSNIFGGGGLKSKISPRETSFDLTIRPEDDRVRGTASATIQMKDDKFLKLGIYDIGAGNKLIVQPGMGIGPKTDFRYGLYASRLGLGLDHEFSSRTFAGMNLYDSYDPRLDVYAGYSFGGDWGLLLGVDRVFDDNQLTLGVRLTK